ncbi:MAG: hypothetical protein WD649_01305 [Thermoleophilaceae bacterium]
MTGLTSRLAALAGLLALASATALGCGSEREEPVDLSKPTFPKETRVVKFPNRGMTVKVPIKWRLERRRAPTVFRLSLGQAQVSAFAYKRKEPLPKGKQQLKDAETRLIAQTRKRNLLYTHVRSRRLEVDGDPAIELVGIQRIARARLYTRSVHVFIGGAEYVFEALAPRAYFGQTSRKVLTPMLRSAKLTGKITVRNTKEVERRKREAERKRSEQEEQERREQEQQSTQGTSTDGQSTQGTSTDGQSTQGTSTEQQSTQGSR